MGKWSWRKKYYVSNSTEKQKLTIKNTKFFRRELILTMLTILTVTAAIIGQSYAVFSSIDKAENYNIVKTGTLQIAYDDTSMGLGNIISLNGTYPMSDVDGQATVPYKFKITNTGTLATAYKVSILDDMDMITEDGCQDKLLGKDKIKYSINGGSPLLLSSKDPNYIVVEGNLGASQSITYEIRMWIDEAGGNEVLGKHYHGKISIEALQTKNGVAVVLPDNMVPVIYDTTRLSWVKADQSDWYDYDKQQWANAVTVSSATRSNYLNAASGTVVNSSDIETMWVYIPRYEYRIEGVYGKGGESLSSPGEIEVNFISTTTTVASNGYTIHPAFTFGDEQLSGLWVGKFEASSSNPSLSHGGGNDASLEAMIVPNIRNWRKIQMSTLYTVVQNMTKSANRYGFNQVDTHPIKNVEWAAAAYLSQSKYGKYGNPDFTGVNKEIYQNKSNEYITGCSSGSPGVESTNYGCHYTYDVQLNGTGASTTGTIYGIYDMSGGSWEKVMGIMQDDTGSAPMSGEDLTTNSGFSGKNSDGTVTQGLPFPPLQYYDLYPYSTSNGDMRERGKIGDATKETIAWYIDYNIMNDSSNPWFMRGGSYSSGITSGVFASYFTGGSDSVGRAFRITLVP